MTSASCWLSTEPFATLASHRVHLVLVILLAAAPASKQQECVNRYDTIHGAGSCDTFITGNATLCRLEFSFGAQYFGYCDASCGFGFCPPHTVPSQFCPSLFASDSALLPNGTSNQLDAAQGLHRCASIIGRRPDACVTLFCPSCAQSGYCDAACGFCVSSVVQAVPDAAAASCFAELVSGIDRALQQCYDEDNGSLYCNRDGCYEELVVLNMTVHHTCADVNYATDSDFRSIVDEQFPALEAFCNPCSLNYTGDLGQRLQRCQHMLGCTDPTAYNYAGPERPLDDGSCSYNPCLAGLDTCDRATQLCNYTTPRNFECTCRPGFSLRRVDQATQAFTCQPNGCVLPTIPQFARHGTCPTLDDEIGLASGEGCNLECEPGYFLVGLQPFCSAGVLRNTVSCHSAAMRGCSLDSVVTAMPAVDATPCSEHTESAATCAYSCQRGFVQPQGVSSTITCQDGTWLLHDATCDSAERQPVCSSAEFAALRANSLHSSDCSLLFTSVQLGLGSALRRGSLCHCAAVIVGQDNVPHCRLHEDDIFTPVETAQECIDSCIDSAGLSADQQILCSGHGDCHEGRCACEVGFSGDYCSMRSCAISPVSSRECGEFGSCNRSSGACICQTGYAGHTCDDPVDCGNTVDSVAHSHSNCVGNTAFAGTPCLVQCNRGYSRESAYFVCGANGFWEGDLQCVMERECTAPNGSSIPHIDETVCGGTPSGEFCTYSCEPGFHYARLESTSIYCYDGVWRAGTASCSPDDCSLQLENGQVSDCTSTVLSHGEACHVMCAADQFAVPIGNDGTAIRISAELSHSYTGVCRAGTFLGDVNDTRFECRPLTWVWEARPASFPPCPTECGIAEVVHRRNVVCASAISDATTDSARCLAAAGPSTLVLSTTCSATPACPAGADVVVPSQEAATSVRGGSDSAPERGSQPGAGVSSVQSPPPSDDGHSESGAQTIMARVFIQVAALGSWMMIQQP